VIVGLGTCNLLVVVLDISDASKEFLIELTLSALELKLMTNLSKSTF